MYPIQPTVWTKDSRCPNCSRSYSRDERIASGCDEEYCCDHCKHEAERHAETVSEGAKP